ncbi:MAG: hypothetical protein JW878_02415 [Methanomicrobia archaeon]|nr:hypothetical protein [Methanomicrobia archaeon]
MKKESSEGLIDFNVDQTDGVDLLTAEGVVRLFSETVMKYPSKSIDIFNYNIQKAKILLALSYKIKKVWPSIVEYFKEPEAPPSSSPWMELISGIGKAFEGGSASYFVFTEQAVVTSVSATEIYYRDILAESINSDLRIAKRFADKEIHITIDQLFQIDFELKSEIGIFLVEKIDFQKVDNIISSYKKAFGNEFGSMMLDDDEIVTLKKIFGIRHLFIHKAGKLDNKFISNTNIQRDIGSHFVVTRKQVNEIINFLEKIVNKSENLISKKGSKK